MNAEKYPSKAAIHLTAGMFYLFGACFLAAIHGVVISLAVGTLMQLMGWVGMMALSYFLANLFRGLHRTTQYNFALSELAWSIHTGKPLSNKASRILQRG